jgi:hypothetical protein
MISRDDLATVDGVFGGHHKKRLAMLLHGVFLSTGKSRLVFFMQDPSTPADHRHREPDVRLGLWSPTVEKVGSLIMFAGLHSRASITAFSDMACAWMLVGTP